MRLRLSQVMNPELCRREALRGSDSRILQGPRQMYLVPTPGEKSTYSRTDKRGPTTAANR